MNTDAMSSIGRYYRALPPVANLVLVVLTGMALARLIWLIVPAPATASGSAPVAAVASAAPATDPRSMVAAIADAHLFRKAAPAAHAAPVDAPETHLNLMLTGVLFSQAPRYSVAIIRDGKGDEQYYQPGDEVVDGVTLSAIHSDRVILKREGRYETLSLSGERETHHATASTRGGTGTSDLAHVRDKLLHDPGSITRFLRLMPVYSNGGLRGYRVYPGRQRSVFQSTGLHPGDLVTAVNGVPLRDPGKIAAALKALSTASSVNVTLKRLGQTQHLTISLR